MAFLHSCHACYMSTKFAQRASLTSYCYLVPSSPIPVALMMEAIRSSKNLFLQEPHGVTSQKAEFLEFIIFSKELETLHSSLQKFFTVRSV
jgi:hypothetical protein